MKIVLRFHLYPAIEMNFLLKSKLDVMVFASIFA